MDEKEEHVNDLFKEMRGHPLENIISGFLFDMRGSLSAISGYAKLLNMINDDIAKQMIFDDMSIREASEEILKNAERLQIWSESLRLYLESKDVANSNTTPPTDENDK